MYRLAAVLALLVAVLVGCGGDSDDGSKPSAPAGATAKDGSGAGHGKAGEDEASPRSDKPSAKGKSKKAGGDEAADDAGKHADDPPDTLGEQLAGASPKQLRIYIRAAVTGTLTTYSLALADLTVGHSGRDVTVVVTRKTACYFVAKDEYTMAQRIQAATRIVKNVRFEVAGSGGTALADYVLRCKSPKIPNGPGKTVYEKTAVGGPVTTKRFRIKGRRWAIEWQNRGNSLAVIVIPQRTRGRKNDYYTPIAAQKPDVGRRAYRGPGTYILKIHGPALWSVRVKDIR